MSFFRTSPKPQTDVDPVAPANATQMDVAQLFTPSGPVQEESLFAGRRQEVDRLVETLLEPCKHAIVYGERGVGKTSLVNMFLLQRRRGLPQFTVVARVQADPSDDYSSLWHKALNELSSIDPASGRAFAATSLPTDRPLNPDSVRRHLQRCCVRNTALIIDEFDRLQSARDAELTADTIKYLSDYNINCTVIIVGVAESLGDLVRNHESLRRSLTCIPLRRMRDDELSELIESRLDRTSLEIEGPAKLKILRLSRGLPFYVHTIAKLGCLAATRSASRRIGVAQVNAAIEQVTDELRQTFCDGVTNMLAGSRGSIFPEVVVASALADADDDGYFSAESVAAPLSRMLRRQMKPASFQRHLTDLASDERGRLLVRRGQPGSHRFRFRDALTQPYVIMDSLCRGLIDEAEALRRPGSDLTAHATAPEIDWTYGSAHRANLGSLAPDRDPGATPGPVF